MRRIRPIEAADRDELTRVLTKSWGSTEMDTRGRLVDVLAIPGFIAEDAGEWLGYVNYENRVGNVEVIALESFVQGQGVGSALLAWSVQAARSEDARRFWLLTSNDNVDALHFYQRRGFVLVAVHRDAITRARETIKPDIPLVAQNGIPIRDEIELELPHAIWDDFVERYSWAT
jgi:GNAT superfamily N-acetyltransferase